MLEIYTRDPNIMHDVILDGGDNQFGIETLKPDEDEIMRGTKTEREENETSAGAFFHILSICLQ